MMQIKLDSRQVGKGSLVLVNKAHPVTWWPGEGNLLPVGQGIKMEAAAACHLNRLLENQRDVVCVSGFRSKGPLCKNSSH